VSFDIRQLRYAVAAADHGSFCRAARALDIDQSTLSRTILKLKNALGMSIFERSRAGVMTTQAGLAFIRAARPMLVSADKLVAMTRAAGQGRAGGLVLGHNSALSAGNLRATMMSWHDAHPDVEVECVEANRSVLLAELTTIRDQARGDAEQRSRTLSGLVQRSRHGHSALSLEPFAASYGTRMAPMPETRFARSRSGWKWSAKPTSGSVAIAWNCCEPSPPPLA
jgi:hypothetical protein